MTMSKKINYIYVGPSVPIIGLRSRTLVLGSDPPPQLKNLMDTKPMIRSLFVPTKQVSEAIASMKVQGSIEWMAANEIVKYAQERKLKERKI
jgi:hypothetical protein